MPRTNPKNDRVKREYLVDLKDARQRSAATVDQARHAIDRLEVYTGFKDFGSFNKEQALGFKRALIATKGRRSGKPISTATAYHVLQALKEFHPGRPHAAFFEGPQGKQKSEVLRTLAEHLLAPAQSRECRTQASQRVRYRSHITKSAKRALRKSHSAPITYSVGFHLTEHCYDKPRVLDDRNALD
jgi:hypothetical protein